MTQSTDDAFELRQAGSGDADAIRRLTREAYAKWIPTSGREPTPMTANYDAAVRDHRFDLLFFEGALAALIETIDEADQLLIENVAVAPRFQRRGLATRLIAIAEHLALQRGYRRVRLYTNQLWDENVRLYLKLGFVVDSEQAIGGGLVRVNMSKRLEPLAQASISAGPAG